MTKRKMVKYVVAKLGNIEKRVGSEIAAGHLSKLCTCDALKEAAKHSNPFGNRTNFLLINLQIEGGIGLICQE